MCRQFINVNTRSAIKFLKVMNLVPWKHIIIFFWPYHQYIKKQIINLHIYKATILKHTLINHHININKQ